MAPTIRDIARWAVELSTDNIPSDVLERARAQRRSVLAAVAAAGDDDGVALVREVVLRGAPEGPVPVVGTDRRADVGTALYATAAASIALDHDDYACFAHPGHSAVLVPLLLAAETGADGRTQVRAQVVANEVACRLGGVSLLGPQNGQLWTAVHAASAALAASVVLGLGAERSAHALALALSQPPRALAPALVGADSKLILAAEPATMGLRAARLAAAGVTGPIDDLLDHPQGFLRAFADVPLQGMLEGLGQVWATRTLSIKPTPGCAYLTAVVEALRDLGPPEADTVAAIEVETSLATGIMDALSAPYVPEVPPRPVTVTFSTPLTVAVTLLAGGLTPGVLRRTWLEDNAMAISQLARRVTVTHAADLTAEAARAFAAVVPPARLVRDAGFRSLRALRRRAPAGGMDGIASAMIRAAVGSLVGGRDGVASRYWDPDTVGRFRMALPARVEVTLRDGRQLRSEVTVPRGAAGHATAPPELVAREKLARHGRSVWRDEETAAIDDAIERDDPELWRLLASTGTR